jgi:hypothetical protein
MSSRGSSGCRAIGRRSRGFEGTCKGGNVVPPQTFLCVAVTHRIPRCSSPSRASVSTAPSCSTVERKPSKSLGKRLMSCAIKTSNSGNARRRSVRRSERSSASSKSSRSASKCVSVRHRPGKGRRSTRRPERGAHPAPVYGRQRVPHEARSGIRKMRPSPSPYPISSVHSLTISRPRLPRFPGELERRNRRETPASTREVASMRAEHEVIRAGVVRLSRWSFVRAAWHRVLFPEVA